MGRLIACLEIGGGCIANAARIETTSGPFFLKYSSQDPGETFEAEAAGLDALRAAESPLLIPQVLAARNRTDQEAGYVLMDWIEQGPPNRLFAERFGTALASLHRSEGPAFGFHSDNFIGRLPQANAWLDAWPSFFVERRLEPQVRLARDAGRWNASWSRKFARLVSNLRGLLPESPEPSILHGDLWSGNYLTSSTGQAVLIDPAVYHGHREADLAMTELFGRFDSGFYAAYRETWPLEDGYEQRREVYNLYHLINHLNHFGSSYASSVERVLRRFG